ncbi:MAG: alpha/beta hydrolase-fold protein, partial [Gaiellaceae bacterium]
MGSISGTLTRRQTLGLAGSSGVAMVAALSGLPRVLQALRLEGAPAAQAASAAGMKAVTASFRSRALGSRLHFAVYLPSAYSASRTHYPVVYFLHGLPAGQRAYLHLGWVAQALAHSSREAILVVPQGTHFANDDPEYHDWGPGDDWETALAQELPAWIDGRYRTLAHRSGRAIAGYSAGGYGASIIGLHHPRTFAAVQSWSGYFHPTDPTGTKARSVGSRAANAYASVEALVPRLAKQFERYPTT